MNKSEFIETRLVHDIDLNKLPVGSAVKVRLSVLGLIHIYLIKSVTLEEIVLKNANGYEVTYTSKDLARGNIEIVDIMYA